MQSAFADEAALLRWIRELFPNEGEPRIAVRVEYRSFHHKMELLRVSFGSDGAAPFVDLFLRTYLGELCWWVLAEPEIPERERMAWSAVARGGVPIPGVQGWCRTDSGAAALLEAVPGRGLWYQCTPLAVADAARVLARLHGLQLEDDEQLRFPRVGVVDLIERWRGWFEGEEDEQTRAALEVVCESLDKAMCRPPALLHGDCHAGNFLSDGRKIVAVLDWESCAVGDPRLDLAVMDGCLRRWNSDELADSFLQEYEKTAGWTVADLRPWKDFLDIRDVVVTSWIERRIEAEQDLPPTRPEAWLKYGHRARERLAGILARHAPGA